MQGQQNPNRGPNSDPDELERTPGRNEENDTGMPAPDRQRDPLQQPGDAPDVKPDVIAGKRGGKDRGQARGPGQGTGSTSGSQSSRGQKQ